MRSAQKRRAGAPTGSRELIGLAGQITSQDSEITEARQVAIDWSGHFRSIHRGRLCLGHAFKTARGYLVTDADDNVIGSYATYEAGREALVRHVGEGGAA
jgi:hypothetical protein